MTSQATQKRILIVDDSPLVRAIVRAMLHAGSRQEWAITEAESGDGLLRAVAAGGTFDAVLLDVQMPGMNGFAACEALRRVDQSVPVVFLSAERDRDSFRRGRVAGGDAYLAKPVTYAALRSALSMLTGLGRKRQASGAAATGGGAGRGPTEAVPLAAAS
jgi:CheY-like chemotaxis protein